MEEEGEQKRVLDSNDMLVMVPPLSDFFLEEKKKANLVEYTIAKRKRQDLDDE